MSISSEQEIIIRYMENIHTNKQNQQPQYLHLFTYPPCSSKRLSFSKVGSLKLCASQFLLILECPTLRAPHWLSAPREMVDA